ncbi:unnamed protein product, partial [Iphiclides podalirius]
MIIYSAAVWRGPKPPPAPPPAPQLHELDPGGFLWGPRIMVYRAKRTLVMTAWATVTRFARMRAGSLNSVTQTSRPGRINVYQRTVAVIRSRDVRSVARSGRIRFMNIYANGKGNGW